MKWQITPAVIDTQSDVNMSMLIPLSVARLGATTLNIISYTDSVLQFNSLI